MHQVVYRYISRLLLLKDGKSAQLSNSWKDENINVILKRVFTQLTAIIRTEQKRLRCRAGEKCLEYHAEDIVNIVNY